VGNYKEGYQKQKRFQIRKLNMYGWMVERISKSQGNYVYETKRDIHGQRAIAYNVM
jgi:hypothetical protein